MQKALHLRDVMDRFSVSGKQEGREHTSIEDSVDTKMPVWFGLVWFYGISTIEG